VGSGTILGGDPQYRGFDHNIPSGVSVGDDNVIREYATIHRSIHPGGETCLGEGNYLMAGSHVGHDASVGNFNTLANNVLLAGHVRVGDRCFLGGGSVFHQFIRVGDLAITQGNSGFSLDLPPFVIGYGINLVAGVNVIGLKRAGFSPSDIRAVKGGFREIFRGGTPIREVLARNTEDTHPGPVQVFYRFLREESKKGVCIRSRGDREDS
jgi:UDP-N-acetylglucosamine acyltransferase